MSWAKNKYVVSCSGGQGEINTAPARGFIQQFIIEPASTTTIWSMDILDRDGDCIYTVKDHEGQLNDRKGLPLGKDQSEQLKIRFYELTKNENIKVIFNIREIQ